MNKRNSNILISILFIICLFTIYSPVFSYTSLNFLIQSGYTSDGLEPETGSTNTNYIFKIAYVNDSNYAPPYGFPLVYIFNNGIQIPLSPFQMTEENYSDTNYTDGKIYTFSKNNLVSGNYTYYFYTNGNYGDNSYTSSTFNGPIVSSLITNNAPTLSWVNEPNYYYDGLHPEYGTSATLLTYKVKYTDSDNDPPAPGYPKVHIIDGSFEIPSSPFTLDSYSGSSYSTGKYYRMSTSLGYSTNFKYYFEARDDKNSPATGSPTIYAEGPDITITGASVSTGTASGNTITVSSNFLDAKSLYNSIDISVPSSNYYKTIKVYNTLGETIKIIANREINNSFTWNGTDENNNTVTPGIYYITYEVDKALKDKKKILVIR